MTWFLNESGSGAARRILSQGWSLAAPDLIRIEVAQVLLRSVRRGLIPLTIADESFSRLSQGLIDLHETTGMIADAYALAANHGGSVYGAAYIALARRLGAELVTQDLQVVATCRVARVKGRLLHEFDGDRP